MPLSVIQTVVSNHDVEGLLPALSHTTVIGHRVRNGSTMVRTVPNVAGPQIGGRRSTTR